MSAIVTTLHVVACIFLITVVLLQRGKGAQVGAVFGGGGGSTMFGSRGAGNFLTKLTTAAATVFMLTSLSLSYLGMTGGDERLFESEISVPETAEESLFEEVGSVPAAEEGAGNALDNAADAGSNALDAAASAAGSALDEASAGIEAAVGEIEAEIDENIPATETQ